MPVWTSIVWAAEFGPEASRVIETEMSVSAVFRVTLAVRGAVDGPALESGMVTEAAGAVTRRLRRSGTRAVQVAFLSSARSARALRELQRALLATSVSPALSRSQRWTSRLALGRVTPTREAQRCTAQRHCAF